LVGELWSIKKLNETFTADQVYVCAWPECRNYILPGMQWKYIWRECKDSKGHKGTELAKAHAYHRIEEARLS